MKRGDSESSKVNNQLSLDIAERVRIMRDGVLNNSGLLVSGFTFIFLIPIMLKGLGAESYGLWVATLSVTGFVGLVDFGLGWSLMREVAASLGDRDRSQTVRFVNAAGKVYVLLGIVGGVVVASLGLPLSGGLHLSAASRKIAPVIFVLAGVTFFADRLLAFTMNVLRGLRQFDSVNLLAIVATLLRAAGIIALIKAGTGLLPVTIWQGVATMAVALAGFAVVGKLEPEFRLRLGQFDWKLLRSHLSFGIASQFSDVAGKIISDAAPLLIGLVLGSGWIAPYHIAQRFPGAAHMVVWSASGPLFPAVAQRRRGQETAHARWILEVGTRWIVVLALPLCLVLWGVAPKLLEAWIGEIQPGMVQVFRLITVGVFVDAIGLASFHLLWGSGAVQSILIILSGVAFTSLGLSLVLLPLIGIQGAAWGFLVPMIFGTIAVLQCACRSCEIRIVELIRRTFEGLLLPTLACLTVSLGFQYLSGPGRWLEVIGAALASGAAYAVTLSFSGARQEERTFVQEILRWPLALARFFYHKLRRRLSHLDAGW